LESDFPQLAAGALNRALNEGEAAAFPDLLKAAEQGCVRAQFLVGLAYHLGRGVAMDYEKASTWYTRAAGNADEFAIANLGIMRLLGQGAPPDPLEAYAWLQSAVGLGHFWLRPALAWLEQAITQGGPPIDAPPVTPETPIFGPCTHPHCDPSRCNVH
jgi:TPR repeat protein